MTTSTLLLNVILALASFVTVINAAMIASDKNAVKNKTVVGDEEERLEISYDPEVLKEIEPGTLQLIGDPWKVLLLCKSTSTTRHGVVVEWLYHGMEERVVEMESHQNLVWLKKFADGPPVARIECMDRDNASISNSTLIYRGSGNAPFLYKYGQTISGTVLNETTAHLLKLPCLLNYPLDNLEHTQLQLFKDGVEVENNCLSYTPEHGYTVNLTKLEHPFGVYECRVANSSDATDFVRMELANDDTLRAEIEVKHLNGLEFFYTNEPNERIFLCKIPKSKFEDAFKWFYLLRNGSYKPLQSDPRKYDTPAPDALHYVDSVRIKFPSADISHVVCLAYTKNFEHRYNNTYAVEVLEAKEPKIVNPPSPTDPIPYTEGMNLTCVSEGDPITFNWLKNGEPAVGLDSINSFMMSNASSTIILGPFKDEVESNYTCIAKNFLGNQTATYRVQLKPDPKPLLGSPATLGICIAALAALMLLRFTIV